MKYAFRLLLLLVSVFISDINPCLAQWVQNNGLTNVNYVYSFAVSGTNLYAGTNGGVFLSTNSGTSWTAVNIGLTNTGVWALAVSGTNIFAGTYGRGVFLSTNNGASWTAAGLPNTFVYSLAVSGTYLYAGNGGGFFVSTNNGTSWTAANAGFPNGFGTVSAILVSGTNLFVGFFSDGVYLSTNNGTNWTAANAGLTNSQVYSLAVSGTNLFAGTSSGGVFLSTNDGTSWTAVNTGLTDRYVYSLAVSGPNLFAGTYFGGVFLSTNNGTSWTAVNTGLITGFSITDVKALAFSGTNLFAGTVGGVFLSTNNGMSWTAVNNGLTAVESSLNTLLPKFQLHQNYPNPFNPTTTIKFQIPISSFVTLKVFDLLGREVATLVNEEVKPGSYERTFEGNNLASGVYFYHLTANSFSQTKKLVLLR